VVEKSQNISPEPRGNSVIWSVGIDTGVISHYVFHTLCVCVIIVYIQLRLWHLYFL